MFVDPDRTGSVDADGNVMATIGGVKFFCGDEELTEPIEKEIAWVFMQYGQWQEDDPEAILEGNRLLAIEYRWKPEESTDQGFEIIGTLSRMFAGYYAQHTVDEGKVVQLRAPLRPDWFVSLRKLKGGSQDLPLWQIITLPQVDILQDGSDDRNSD